MALTLAESAKLSQNDLQRGVMELFVQESVILDRLPLIDVIGNAYAYNEEATLPGVEFRAVNNAYSESTGTVNQKVESLVILGGDADLDLFIAKTRSNLNDQRANVTRMKVKAASFGFQDAFINGDTSVNALSFDGLKKRLAGSQVVPAATNGLPVLGADDNARQTFFDALDKALAQVPGIGPSNGAIYCNRDIKAKIGSAARRLLIYNTTVDSFGRTIETYKGIPILDLGFEPDNSTYVLPQNETQGTSTGNTSSVYICKFGRDEYDGGVSGLSNGGVDVRDLGELEVKPAYRTRIEFFCGLAAFGRFPAVRLTGVLNA